MKKKISCLTAILMIAGTGVNVSARTTDVNENIVLHGNKCGRIVVESDIERDVHINIECFTPEAQKYNYYEEVIREEDEDRICEFIVEGDNEAIYKITIGTAEYRGSEELNTYSDELLICDTDEETENHVEGYRHIYRICEGEDIIKESIYENNKDDDNVINYESNIYFPIKDYFLGDANLDNNVNIRDAAYIAKLLSQAKGTDLSLSSDFNADGKADVRDAASLAKYLAGANV